MLLCVVSLCLRILIAHEALTKMAQQSKGRSVSRRQPAISPYQYPGCVAMLVCWYCAHMQRSLSACTDKRIVEQAAAAAGWAGRLVSCDVMSSGVVSVYAAQMFRHSRDFGFGQSFLFITFAPMPTRGCTMYGLCLG